MADTLESSAARRGAMPAFRQTVSFRPSTRRYRIGEIDASEQGMYSSWMTRFRRALVRVDVTPVVYRGDTSSTASRPQVSFGGTTPVSGRLDLAVRSADTLRVFAQSGSMPGSLTGD